MRTAMRTIWIVLVLAVSGGVLAANLTVEFGDKNPQTVPSYTEGGTVWAAAEGLATGLGVRIDGAMTRGKLLFRLGKRVSYSATVALRGNTAYVAALELARGLGYAPTLAADGSKLTVKFNQKVVCEDFEFQEQAQRFFSASSRLAPYNPTARDPFKLDKDGDGKACEFLPEQDK